MCRFSVATGCVVVGQLKPESKKFHVPLRNESEFAKLGLSDPGQQGLLQGFVVVRQVFGQDLAALVTGEGFR